LEIGSSILYETALRFWVMGFVKLASNYPDMFILVHCLGKTIPDSLAVFEQALSNFNSFFANMLLKSR